MTITSAERRVIEAAKRCCERWGFAKVTVDDIASEAGVSRATLYRLFPGGKDVLFEAMRVLELEEFFSVLQASLTGTETAEDLLCVAVVESLRAMRADDHLALLLAAAPGETIGQLTVEGVPRIIRVATLFLTPMLSVHVSDRDLAARVVELLVRLVISEFLAPSQQIDLTDDAVTRDFVRAFVLPALQPALSITR